MTWFKCSSFYILAFLLSVVRTFARLKFIVFIVAFTCESYWSSFLPTCIQDTLSSRTLGLISPSARVSKRCPTLWALLRDSLLSNESRDKANVSCIQLTDRLMQEFDFIIHNLVTKLNRLCLPRACPSAGRHIVGCCM